MSEAENPKRKFWQLHLSTAMIMMFVAGGLIYANVREMTTDPGGSTFMDRYVSSIEFGGSKFNEEEIGLFRDVAGKDRPRTMIRYYGIPYSCNMFSTSVEIMDANGTTHYRIIARHWNADSIVSNTLVSLLIIFFVMRVCETLIRRREGRKP